MRNTLELHPFNGQPYYLGAFLLGAYQEILGDLHNLFGDTNAVHVTLEDGEVVLDGFIKGDTVREVLNLSLSRESFEVFEAANGEDGLKMIFECNPDLVICDLMMPRMNGVELLQRVRSDAQTRHLPMLMLTAADSEENELQLMVSGADDFVSKTAEHKLLLARIRRLIGRSG